MTARSPLSDFIARGTLSLQTGPFGSQLHSYDYVEEGVPVIPTEGIQQGRIDHSVLPKITDKKCAELERHRVHKDDILFARRGAQATGRTALIRKSEAGFICGTGAIRARVEDRDILDPKFLAWFLSTPSTVTWIREQAIGATMPNLNTSIIGRIKVPLLPLPEQREIAAILGALDDKIELNRKMAATLEAMARALYRSWFVDFDPVTARAEGRAPAHMPPATAALFPDRFGEDGLPEGWSLGILGDIARNSRKGADPKTTAPDTPYVGLEHIPRRSISISDWGRAEDVGSTKSIMKKGQFLFGKLRPYFHKVGLVPLDGICSTDILVVEAKSDSWREFVLSVISSVDLVEHVNAASTGTRMPRAKWHDLANYQVVMPSPEIAIAYSKIVRPMHDRITSMLHESRTLATLRDTLLPRLMSGELRVPAARDIVRDIA
jgi:type I restriction enzyme S subunit